ncbi:copper homeostasis protein CutC [Salipaludibacillus daqingensis]|uniref:copper homeostasis protein CutC n=1 Tax=Salipaludibacillus daqingensis TaxID=3041001 RepID=UPI002474F6FB|nr:copper homeostasis protein CutC [Salipaludibacillus daqingensis]
MGKLEIIVQNEKDALEAEKFGADQLELVSAIDEGGLTPSYGTIKRVVKSVDIPVMVMIRPHSYSFHYTDLEALAIIEDVQMIRNIGAAGIVFGALTKDNTIDRKLLRSVIDAAGEMDITFHRAFDHVDNVKAAYRTLCDYSNHVTRILTSGGKDEVQRGLSTLQSLMSLQKQLSGPVIMPGGGLNEGNIERIHKELFAEEYHIGSAMRINRKYSERLDDKKMHNLRLLIGE